MTLTLLKRWWWLAVPIALLLSWYSGVLFDGMVEERLRKLGSELAGKGYHFTLERADPELFAGSITVYGITLTYDSTLRDSLRDGALNELLHIKADKLMIRQVSYWELLTRNEVKFRAVQLDGPYIKYLFKPNDDDPEDEVADEVVNEEETAELPSLIKIDTLLVLSATGHTIDITGKRPSLDVAEIDIRAYDASLRTYSDGTITYRVAGSDILARDLRAELPPMYDARIASFHMEHPSGQAFLEGLTVKPRASPEKYRKLIPYENDLFDISLDSIWIRGIEVGRFLSDQVLHMRSMKMSSPVAVIHRDKSMPDGPFNYKHLPVSGLKKLGISIRIDSVEVDDGKVEYHERMEQTSDYGVVVFNRINGLLLGLDNSKRAAAQGREMVANATARMYENTSINFKYRAPLNSKSDQFFVEAQIGEIPFTALNKMTDDLLSVKATAGKIHSMELKMQGNEDKATGTLDLDYEDLHIDLSPHEEKWHKGLLKNLLGNALVKKKNSVEDKRYRQGEFEVERRKDRAIFNFLWQGVKMGTVDSMAPGLLRKPMKKAAEPKNT
jgi:hypothetical protein